jgi:RNA polymerase sigma-70 factor (ECF subfamily)
MHAYERLYQLQGAWMKNLARNLLGTQSDAEDAVQETFLKVQRGIGSFRAQSSFVTWTFRILVNTRHDLRRKRSRRREFSQESPEQAPRPEPRAAGAHLSLKLALERALARLTQQQRDVFLLYDFREPVLYIHVPFYPGHHNASVAVYDGQNWRVRAVPDEYQQQY